MDVLGKWQKTSIHNRIAGDSWGTVSWNDGKGFFVAIWLDCFYLSDDLIAPGVLLKYWLYINTCWPLYAHVFIIIWIERSWWILGLNRGSNMWLKASIFGLGKGPDQRYPVIPFNGWVLELQPRVLLQCCVLETLFLEWWKMHPRPPCRTCRQSHTHGQVLCMCRYWLWFGREGFSHNTEFQAGCLKQ